MRIRWAFSPKKLTAGMDVDFDRVSSSLPPCPLSLMYIKFDENLKPTKWHPLLQVIMARSIGAGFILTRRDPSNRCGHAEPALLMARLEYKRSTMPVTRVNNTVIKKRVCSGSTGGHVFCLNQLAATCHTREKPTCSKPNARRPHTVLYPTHDSCSASPELMIQTSGLHRSGKANCSTWDACPDATCSPAPGTALYLRPWAPMRSQDDGVAIAPSKARLTAYHIAAKRLSA